MKKYNFTADELEHQLNNYCQGLIGQGTAPVFIHALKKHIGRFMEDMMKKYLEEG